uniref:Caspase recruitment domain-containing protein 11-like n=1 Tax=Phallusia mammillata TaxID=59560 RepID=A0A6F9D939_9ASCI|nr:caspase recruitment domain-containing protein 11-like [Phallusia mammillata]
MSTGDNMENWEEHEMMWKDDLQSYRMHLVESVNYQKICPALLTHKVIDNEDHEELSNHYTIRTEKMRTNRLIDILQRKNEQSYLKFLDVLGAYYPIVFTEMTGKEPKTIASDTSLFDVPKDELCPLLMQALDRMQQENFDFSRRLSRCSHALEDRIQECERSNKKIKDLQQRVDRYDNIDSEMATLRQDVDRLKTENYTVCMRMIDTNSENSKLRDTNMKLKNDNDKLRVDLQKLESCVALERNQSVRLRNRLQCSPSDRDIMEMKKEIDELKLKLAQAHSQSYRDEDNDMRIQILKRDKDEAIEMYAEALDNLNKLREDCANAESARDKYLDEKEQLDLTCSVLRSDCDMYKMRRDTVWQQLQEVEKEREMVMKERNEAQSFAKACMQEKAQYRTQIRQLEERFDQQTQSLLEKEREVLSVKAILRDQNRIAEGCSWPNTYKPTTNSIGTSTASSTPTAQTDSDEASDRGFRKRTHRTKYYSKFLKSSEIYSQPDVGVNLNGIKNVFPEIPLAPNYGPNDKDGLAHPQAQNRKRLYSMEYYLKEDLTNVVREERKSKEIKRQPAHRRKKVQNNSSSSKQRSSESMSTNSNEDSPPEQNDNVMLSMASLSL